MVGNIILRVLSRTVSLGVGIDAEYRVVARLARPHPVVGLATVLTHRLRHGEHQAHILEVAIGGQVILVTLIEGLHLNTQGRILLAHTLLPGILDAIHDSTNIRHALAFQLRHDGVGDVLLFYHETDEEVFVRQLFLIALGIEAVQHVVMLDGRVLADGVETTVVVGKHQAVGRYHDTRAIAAEVNHGILDGMVTLVQLLHRQLETILLHLLIDGSGQVIEGPHALVSVCSECTQTHQC